MNDAPTAEGLLYRYRHDRLFQALVDQLVEKRIAESNPLQPYLDKALAALGLARAELQARGQWQDISTAPKDGTAMLGYSPGRKGYIARQDVIPIHWSEWGGGTWDNSTSGHHVHDQITHWMPLPTPPLALDLARGGEGGQS